MSFDTLAPWYRAMELLAFGRTLQRARTAFVDPLRYCRRALCVGEGNGRFLGEFLRVNPLVEVDCVEQSSAMICRARRTIAQFGAAHRVRFHHADIRAWAGQRNCYDLIVTQFFLDCFTEDEARNIVDLLSALAQPNASWLIAEFHLPAVGLRRLHARLWLRLMYEFFGRTTGIRARELAAFAPLLTEAGFTLERRKEARLGLVQAQLWRRS